MAPSPAPSLMPVQVPTAGHMITLADTSRYYLTVVSSLLSTTNMNSPLILSPKQDENHRKYSPCRWATRREQMKCGYSSTTFASQPGPSTWYPESEIPCSARASLPTPTTSRSLTRTRSTYTTPTTQSSRYPAGPYCADGETTTLASGGSHL